MVNMIVQVPVTVLREWKGRGNLRVGVRKASWRRGLLGAIKLVKEKAR